MAERQKGTNGRARAVRQESKSSKSSTKESKSSKSSTERESSSRNGRNTRVDALPVSN